MSKLLDAVATRAPARVGAGTVRSGRMAAQEVVGEKRHLLRGDGKLAGQASR